MSHRIVIVPDNLFESRGEHLHLKLRPTASGGPAVLIAPHKWENTANVDLLRIACFCRANGIRLIGYGSRLQLPMLSTWADEVYLYKGRTDHLYATTGWQSVYNLDYYHRQRTHLARLRALACNCGAAYQEADVANFSPISDWLQRVRRAVASDDVVAAFTWQTVFVRESTYRLYEQLLAEGILPNDCIWCEVAYNERPAPANTVAVLDYLRTHDFGLPLVGIGTNRDDHYALQRRLLKRAGEHYMGVQVLCSMLARSFMLCISGSANLFSIIPTRNVALTDRYLQTVVTDLPEDEHRFAAHGVAAPAAIIRRLLGRRFGSAAERVLIEPWQDPCRALASAVLQRFS